MYQWSDSWPSHVVFTYNWDAYHADGGDDGWLALPGNQLPIVARTPADAWRHVNGSCRPDQSVTDILRLSTLAQSGEWKRNSNDGYDRLVGFITGTARRYAKRGIPYMPSSCVCVSVSLSVTLQYCIKTAKRMITQIMPHYIPGTLFLWHQSSRRNSKGITTPPTGATNAGGVG